MEEVGVVAPVTAVFEGTAPLTMEVGVVAPVTAVFEGTAPVFYVTYPLSRWSLLFYMLIEGGEPS